MSLPLTISKLRKSDKFFHSLLLVTVVLTGILYSTLSVVRHNRFQSGGFDLGLYDQTVWLYSRLLSPYNTVKERFILGDHLNLTLPLLSPLFYLWDNVRVILIFQSFFMAVSAVAVYKISRLRKLGPLVSYVLSFLYLLFYGMQYLIFFDFHAVALGVGLLIWFVYFWEKGNKKAWIITLILCLLTQENMGIAVAGLGCIYFFQPEKRKAALFFIFGGLFFSYLASKVIALFSPVGFQYQPQIDLSLKNLLGGFFNSPEKRRVWLYSYTWWLFLPLFSPGAFLAVLLDLAQYFLSGPEFSRMWSPFMHHRAVLAVFLALGTMDVLVFLKKKKINPELVAVVLFICALFQQFYFHYPLNKLSKKEFWQTGRWMSDNKKLFSRLPKSASVATQQDLVPHLSHRKEIYLVWPRQREFTINSPCSQKNCWYLDFSGRPEFLVVDLHPHQWLTQLLESNENFSRAVKNMEKTGKIKLISSVNDAGLYKINY